MHIDKEIYADLITPDDPVSLTYNLLNQKAIGLGKLPKVLLSQVSSHSDNGISFHRAHIHIRTKASQFRKSQYSHLRSERR